LVNMILKLKLNHFDQEQLASICEVLYYYWMAEVRPTLKGRLGEVCRQVAAVLFKIEVTVKLGLTKTSSTSEVCKWNKTFREKVSSLLVIQNVLVGTNKCVW